MLVCLVDLPNQHCAVWVEVLSRVFKLGNLDNLQPLSLEVSIAKFIQGLAIVNLIGNGFQQISFLEFICDSEYCACRRYINLLACYQFGITIHVQADPVSALAADRLHPFAVNSVLVVLENADINASLIYDVNALLTEELQQRLAGL